MAQLTKVRQIVKDIECYFNVKNNEFAVIKGITFHASNLRYIDEAYRCDDSV